MQLKPHVYVNIWNKRPTQWRPAGLNSSRVKWDESTGATWPQDGSSESKWHTDVFKDEVRKQICSNKKSSCECKYTNSYIIYKWYANNYIHTHNMNSVYKTPSLQYRCTTIPMTSYDYTSHYSHVGNPPRSQDARSPPCDPSGIASTRISLRTLSDDGRSRGL